MVQYRNGAEMLRTIADGTFGEEHQWALLSAAQQFDDEAASLENEARSAHAPG